MTSSRGTYSASQQSDWPASQANGEIRRPSTLKATVLVSTLGVLSALASVVLTFADGRSMLSSSLGLGPGEGGALVSSALDAAYSTLTSRAIVALVVAVIIAALIIGVRGGRTGMRVGLTIMLTMALGAWGLNTADSGVPGLLRGLDALAVVFALVAIVLVWLPPNNRYARERKALRAARKAR
jgi:hypothetical protein